MPGSVSIPGSTKGYDTAATAANLVERDSNGGVTATRFLSTGTAPTAAAGSNAGTTAPSPVVASGSTDARGSVTGGTGTGAAAGNLIAVTFNVAFASAPVVSLTPTNSATAALLPYVTSISTTGFTVAVQGAPASSQANTTYGVAWQVIG